MLWKLFTNIVPLDANFQSSPTPNQFSWPYYHRRKPFPSSEKFTTVDFSHVKPFLLHPIQRVRIKIKRLSVSRILSKTCKPHWFLSIWRPNPSKYLNWNEHFGDLQTISLQFFRAIQFFRLPVFEIDLPFPTKTWIDIPGARGNRSTFNWGRYWSEWRCFNALNYPPIYTKPRRVRMFNFVSQVEACWTSIDPF